MNRFSLYSLCLAGIVPASVIAASSPTVLNKYPACDYEVLDTVETSKIVNFDRVSTIARAKQDTINHLVGELRDDAREIGAASVALINRTLTRTVKDYGKMTLTAELISDCKSENKGTGETTPYSADGVVQVDMGSITTSSTHSMTLDLAPPRTAQPALGDDRSIDTESGMYGLRLGASKQQMLNKFGTPTFEFALSDKTVVFAYGRTHWLTFIDDAMVEARYGTELFTKTLLNYLPFDDRFDDRQWVVTPTLKKSAVLEPEQAQQLTTTLRGDNALLDVKTETYLVNNQQANEVRVTGFELLKRPTAERPSLQPSLTDISILSHAFRQLEQGNNKLSLDTIPYTDFGRSRATSDGQYHLYNAYTLIESVGRSVSEIHVNPNFMAAAESTNADWRFGDFYFGQTEEEALAAAGDNAFYFDHMIEYDKDNYTAKIYLEKEGDQYRVYSMKVSVY